MRSVALLLLAGSCCAQQPMLGRLSFPTSGPAAAQQRFLRGVALLHSFEYRDAREEFLAARRMSPGFAMAAWGEAMTYNEPIWFERNDAAARAALIKLAPTSAGRLEKASTQREKAYLEAVEILYGEGSAGQRDFAYAAAMKRLHDNYPDDDEAAVFYALALLGTCHSGRNPRIYMQAAALLEDILSRRREHPGALHYLIHCYDDPIHAPLGLRAARVYSKVAADAPHALHMPSHIFFALGMWDEAAASNTGAWQASLRKSQRSGAPMEAGGCHALWWLMYANLQQGRYQEAQRILQSMQAISDKNTSALYRFHVLMMRAAYSIDTGESYMEGVEIDDLDVPARATHWLVSGLSAVQQGKRSAAEHALAQLRSLSNSATSSAAPQHSAHVHPSDSRAVQIMENELAAVLSMSDGNSKMAIERLKQAAVLEDQTPFEFGPPLPVKPAHELLGEVLLQLGRWDDARRQFEAALLRAPRRALSVLGLARSFDEGKMGKEAVDAYKELRKVWSKADPPLLRAIDARLNGR